MDQELKTVTAKLEACMAKIRRVAEAHGRQLTESEAGGLVTEAARIAAVRADSSTEGLPTSLQDRDPALFSVARAWGLWNAIRAAQDGDALAAVETALDGIGGAQ